MSQRRPGRAPGELSAFRRHAVWALADYEYPARVIGRQLGISESVIRYYLSQPRPARLMPEARKFAEARVSDRARLRREIQATREAVWALRPTEENARKSATKAGLM
jgi:hypothetical protein